MDYWQQFKSNGDRVCSFCGSLHPDDFVRMMTACADAPADAPFASVPEIEPTDKGYKVYVHRQGVRNAHEGGIKFYTQHFNGGDRHVDLFRRAVAASDVRRSRMVQHP